MASPLDQLATAYQQFRGKGSDILALRHDVTLLIQRAKQTGQTGLLPQLNQQATDLNNLYYEWVDTDGKVRDIISQLKALHIPLPSGIGELGVLPALVLPAILVASVAAVVVTIVSVLGKYETQRQLLKAVKDRVLSPAEALKLGNQPAAPGVFGDLKTVLTLGAVVLGLAMLKPVLGSLTEKRS